MIGLLECLYLSPRNLIVWHANTDERAFEAWERMTIGGAGVNVAEHVYPVYKYPGCPPYWDATRRIAVPESALVTR